jgi:MobA/MobL family protein
MAIPYFNVQFTHVRGDGGACETMTYLGRCQAMDVRLAQRFDFRHLGGDLVHSEIMRTEGVSEAFDDLEYLANSVDEAEVYPLRGDIDNRLRQTQNGAVLVLALPPASEMTLTEATELTRRIARLIAGDRRLAIHIAIHDPAMMQPGARNRHAHLFFPRREIEYDQLAGPAIRDLFARPMQISAGGHAVTVEGNRWPDFYRRQQQMYFAEQGLELVVDPIAPFPGRHWQTEIKLDDPRVQRNRSRIWRLNVQAIHDDPVWLVGKLLRGQSTIRIAELQRLLDRFIDHEGQRQHILENILSRPDIVTLAADPVAEKPRFVTTAEVCNSVQRACELVDRAAVAEGPAICTITAASHAAAVERFDELLGRAGFERPLLVGNNHSECQDLSNAIQDSRPKVTTIKRALSDLSKMVFPDRPSAKSRAQNRLIIVPRAESVEDQPLAKLILAAHERGTPLILLHDQSKQSGIVSHRLAAYAADLLAAAQAVDDESYAEAVERFLRAGLVGPAIQLMAQRQDIGFKAVDYSSDEDTGFDFFLRSTVVATQFASSFPVVAPR